MANEIVITLTKIIYSSLLISCPFWFLGAVEKITFFKDTITQTVCLTSLASIPFTLLYTLYKQIWRSDKTLSTAFIPIIPFIALYTTSFISKTLQKGSNRQR